MGQCKVGLEVVSQEPLKIPNGIKTGAKRRRRQEKCEITIFKVEINDSGNNNGNNNNNNNNNNNYQDNNISNNNNNNDNDDGNDDGDDSDSDDGGWFWGRSRWCQENYLTVK